MNKTRFLLRKNQRTAIVLSHLFFYILLPQFVSVRLAIITPCVKSKQALRALDTWRFYNDAEAETPQIKHGRKVIKMALYWYWKDKCGEVEFHNENLLKRPHKNYLYDGNAFAICITEYEDDDTYQMRWFATDKDHMKNMCGLKKEFKDNVFADFNIKKIKIDYNNKNMRDLLKIIIDSKTPIEIEIYDGKTPF